MSDGGRQDRCSICGQVYYGGGTNPERCGCPRLLPRIRELERALVLAAIPLEALHATELDGRALCDGVKQGVREAVQAIRAVIGGEA